MKQYQPKIKVRKFNNKCEKCNKKIKDSEAFIYVDGNNCSITMNSPYLCKECYKEKYIDKIIENNKED